MDVDVGKDGGCTYRFLASTQGIEGDQSLVCNPVQAVTPRSCSSKRVISGISPTFSRPERWPPAIVAHHLQASNVRRLQGAPTAASIDGVASAARRSRIALSKWLFGPAAVVEGREVWSVRRRSRPCTLRRHAQ